MKKIIISAALLFGFLSILGCQQEDLDIMSEQFFAEHDYETEDGVKYCEEFSKGGWFGASIHPCVEQISYPPQISNHDDTQFDPNSYTPAVNNSGSLAGKWMQLNDDKSPIKRQICEFSATQTPDFYRVSCAKESASESWREYEEFTYDATTQEAFFYEEKDIPIRNDRNPGTFSKRLTASVSGMNLLQLSEQRDYAYGDGTSKSETKYIYSFVRLAANMADPIGMLTVERKDYENNLILMEQYPIVTFEEVLGDGWTFKGENGEVLARLPALHLVKIPPDILGYYQGISYGHFRNFQYALTKLADYEDYFPGVADALFEFLPMPSGDYRRPYSDPSKYELRLRQFDVLQHDAQGLEIDFLVSRRYAERFKLDKTVGKIQLQY